MRRRSELSSIRWAGRVVLALTAMVFFQGSAGACRPTPPEPPNVKILWDEAPKAEPGEVVLRARFLRTETMTMRRDPKKDVVVITCGGPAPAPTTEEKVTVSVYEVVRIAKGKYRSRKVTLLGAGYEHPFTEGWMVGKPSRLDFTRWGYLSADAQPLPEPRTIAWRPPPCPQYHSCPAFNPGILKVE